MKAAKITYTGGMNQDVSKSRYPANAYYEGNNVRITTDSDGLATTSLQNEPGTEFKVSLPGIENVYDLSAKSGTSVTITINGVVIYQNPSPYSYTTSEEFKKALLENSSVSTAVDNGDYTIEDTGDSVVIIGLNTALTVSTSGLTASLQVSAKDTLYIIGASILEDEVIIFSTSAIEEGEDNDGQVWKFNINEVNNEVEGTVNGELVPSEHLYYNNKLGFSTEHEIGYEVVARYENPTTGRLYWTDDHNPVRVISLLDGKPFNIKPNDLDLVSDATLSQPIVTAIESGSLATGSVIQFFYRLFNKGGTETIVSTGSDLIQLTEDNPTASSYQEYQGSSVNSSANKSVTYIIENIDRNYEYMEHIAAIYSYEDSPTIYKFGESDVPKDGSIEITHTGNETTTSISAQELNLLNNVLTKAKTLDQKGNYLIAANTETNDFDVDFDARAYRFDSSGTASIYNSEGDLEDSFTNSSYPTDEELDAINPYNDETDDNYTELKYQSDGITLGGSGPNVTYKIISERLHGDTRITNGIAGNNPFISVQPAQNTVTSSIDFGTGAKTIDNNGYFENFKSPILAGCLKGYARGEVYRFGISFFDKKGNASYVKWIGDIRIPESYETKTNDTVFSNWSPGSSTTDSEGISELQSIGIQFTVDVSSISEEISGYEIVRVERTEADKTRLGTGMLVMVDDESDTGNLNQYNVINQIASNSIDVDNEISFDSSGDGSTATTEDVSSWYLKDNPSMPINSNAVLKTVCSIIGPTSQFSGYNNYEFKSGDFIRGTGYYNTSAIVNMTNDTSAGIYYRANSYVLPDDFEPKSFLMNASRKLTFGEKVNAGDFITSVAAIIPKSYGEDEIVNASYCEKGSGIPVGVGDPKHFIGLESNTNNTPTGVSNGGPLDSDYSNPIVDLDWDGLVDSNSGDSAYFTFSSSVEQGAIQTGFYLKEMLYCRLLRKQYGGNTNLDRSKNQYITTGSRVELSLENTNTTNTTKVFGGDVYVTYYDDEYLNQNWLTADNRDDFNTEFLNGESNKMAIAMTFPCEVSVNTELRMGTHWAKDRDSDNYSAYISNDYSLNTVYNQENNLKQVYYAKDALFSDNSISPHRIWASEKKIDGELLDSWRNFKSNTYIEVDGVHGEINKIKNFKDNLYYYQNAAMGVASVNERVTQSSGTGAEIVLGTGAVLDHYNYISTNTGCSHRFGVVASNNNLYHFDVRDLKLYQFAGGGTTPLSDVKGMNSYFRSNIIGNISTKDQILNAETPVGIHGIYDVKNNRVLYTFLDYYYTSQGQKYSEIPTVEVEVEDDADFGGGLSGAGGDDSLYVLQTNNYTFSFNEMLGSFESFYDYTPPLYIRDRHKLMSISSYDQAAIYMHEYGEYCKYYDQDAVDSTLKLVLADNPDLTKTFTNLEFNMEVTENGVDVLDSTFNTLSLDTSYQTTGDVTLVPDSNIIRRMRKWRVDVPRESGSADNARLRDFYSVLELTYENSDDRRMIIHDLLYKYMISNY